MVGADDALNPAKVALAAKALVESYGERALEHAVALERESVAKSFAAAVREEVARRLGTPPADN